MGSSSEAAAQGAQSMWDLCTGWLLWKSEDANDGLAMAAGADDEFDRNAIGAEYGVQI